MEENYQSESVKNFYETEEWRQLLAYLKKETIAEAVVRTHRNCGSHSNIPSCCVDFFIKYWRGRMHKSWVGDIYRFFFRSWYPANRRPAYVPCPKCVLKRYAQPLYECDCQWIGVGECKPTGRVIGFYNDPPLPDVPQTIPHR